MTIENGPAPETSPRGKPGKRLGFLTLFIALATFIAGIALERSGRLPGTTPTPAGSPTEADHLHADHESMRKILYWVAPMDANYRRDQPGKSPMGMDLVPVYADNTETAGVVRIDPRVRANLGVRTETAQRGLLSRRIDTVGFISYDEETIQHFHTRVEGWVESLAVTTMGDPVVAGQVLFELYSPTLVNAQKEFLATFDDQDPSFRRASRERLAALGMEPAIIKRLEDEREVLERVPFTAAIDGHIAHLGVREGIFVTPATEVLSVARLDTVWVLVDVLERQADWVSPGQTAIVTVDHRPDDPLEGIVDYIYPELDPESRTLRARVRFDNPDELLRPNMYASVSIKGRPLGPVTHVPREAVIRSGRGNRIVIEEADGEFSVRDVLVGIESGDRVAIRRGLRPGDEVVVSGQFLIDSEASVKSALERLAGEQNPQAPES